MRVIVEIHRNARTSFRAWRSGLPGTDADRRRWAKWQLEALAELILKHPGRIPGLARHEKFKPVTFDLQFLPDVRFTLLHHAVSRSEIKVIILRVVRTAPPSTHPPGRQAR